MWSQAPDLLMNVLDGCMWHSKENTHTHSLSHTDTNSLTHSHTHTLTHTRTHAHTHTLTHSHSPCGAERASRRRGGHNFLASREPFSRGGGWKRLRNRWTWLCAMSSSIENAMKVAAGAVR